MAKTKRKRRSDHSADTRGLGFAGIPISVIKSEAYRNLDVYARAVLVEIVARMRGYNNGTITVSYKQLAHSLNRKNEAKIGKAIASLIMHGLVEITAESNWKDRRAREYRLTFVNTTDAIGRPIAATNDYLAWRAPASDATTVVARKAKFTTTRVVVPRPKAATTAEAVRFEIATAPVVFKDGNEPFPISESATIGVAPISNPYPPPSEPQTEHQPRWKKVPCTNGQYTFD
ncbi:MAG: hypothetical protein WBH10_04360 [Allopontixanthobacter sediminis]